MNELVEPPGPAGPLDQHRTPHSGQAAMAARLQAVTIRDPSSLMTGSIVSPDGIRDVKPIHDAMDAPALNTMPGDHRTAAELSQSQISTLFDTRAALELALRRVQEIRS